MAVGEARAIGAAGYVFELRFLMWQWLAYRTFQHPAAKLACGTRKTGMRTTANLNAARAAHCAIGASPRRRREGPWEWRAMQGPTHRVAPQFRMTTFVRRVRSGTLEEGLGAPRPSASEWVICIRIDRVMSARDAGA